MTKEEKCSITQKGRIVINNGINEKRVLPDELDFYLAQGWSKGITNKHIINTSNSRKGTPSPKKGKPMDPEVKEKLRKSGSWFKKGQSPWNKGLTKDTDERVKQYSTKSAQTKIDRYGSSFPFNNMNEEHKNKISESLKGKPNSYKGCKRDPEVGKHISEAKIKKGYKHTQETKNKISKTKKGKHLSPEKLLIKLNKEYITKKLNNSFNKSSSEEEFYRQLLKENVNKTIYRQYKDPNRYPFYCDFYILEDDLFIELNSHWTHGRKPFNINDPECQEKLAFWQEKAKVSEFYKNAIETWTIRDVKKKEYAEKNNLNYKVIY